MTIPNYLYKYFTEERVDILENGLIRYTQPMDFNDPFDSLPYLKSMANHEIIDEFIEKYENEASQTYEKILKEELNKIPNFAQLSPQQKDIIEAFLKKKLEKLLPKFVSQTKELFFPAFKFDGNFKELMLNAVLTSFNNSIGILCFTEKKDNLLMWSHYANSHKGFVLEFFPEHSYFDQRKNKNQMADHLKKVRYTNKRPEFVFFDNNLSSEENVENWIKNLIWVKSDHWHYEEEWRITTTLKECKKIIQQNNIQKIYLFPFPYDAIKSIFLGCKMPPENQTALTTFIRNKKEIQHINIYKVIPDEKEYTLTFHKVE